jgi:hypothetical protein
VRIRPKEWIDKQDKDIGGSIDRPMKSAVFSSGMSIYAGKTAEITRINNNCCKLDIDDGSWIWQDWMFDPDYNPDEPLSAEDAIRAMLAGETLYDEHGLSHSYTDPEIRGFYNLHRRPAKSKRSMTGNEAFVWAESEASLGWMVRNTVDNKWTFPRFFAYRICRMENYQRARILPDNSGIDESTVQGFEVEE